MPPSIRLDSALPPACSHAKQNNILCEKMASSLLSNIEISSSSVLFSNIFTSPSLSLIISSYSSSILALSLFKYSPNATNNKYEGHSGSSLFFAKCVLNNVVISSFVDDKLYLLPKSIFFVPVLSINV